MCRRLQFNRLPNDRNPTIYPVGEMTIGNTHFSNTDFVIQSAKVSDDVRILTRDGNAYIIEDSNYKSGILVVPEKQ